MMSGSPSCQRPAAMIRSMTPRTWAPRRTTHTQRVRPGGEAPVQLPAEPCRPFPWLICLVPRARPGLCPGHTESHGHRPASSSSVVRTRRRCRGGRLLSRRRTGQYGQRVARQTAEVKRQLLERPTYSQATSAVAWTGSAFLLPGSAPQPALVILPIMGCFRFVSDTL
jgi:hypothetical protein